MERTASSEARGGGLNLAIALLLHVFFGFCWLSLSGVGVAAIADDAVTAIWIGSAAVLWVVAMRDMARARANLGRVWGTSFLWWLASFVAPVVLIVRTLQLLRRSSGSAERDGEAERPAANEMSDPILERLDAAERRLGDLQRELRELRALVAAPSAP
ncbi:MAG: hypothetical protein ACRDNX_09580, partial [Gaiellaceae bacterium]